jgi:hypothetical protein
MSSGRPTAPRASDLRAELEAILADGRREAADALARATDRAAAAIEPRLSRVVDRPDWVPLKAAAMLAGVHYDTMLARVKRYGLGLQDGKNGPWRVDMTLVRAQQDGRPYRRLSQELSAGRPADFGNVQDDSEGAPGSD